MVDTGSVGGDIYTFVLKQLVTQMDKIRDVEFVEQWKQSGLLVRGLTKVPVMTKNYNCVLYGVKDGVKDFILDKDAVDCFTDMMGKANKMGELIWDSMESAMEGVSCVMRWYEACAKVVGGQGLPFQWKTHLGMKCIHDQKVQKSKPLRYTIKGIQKEFFIKQDTDQIHCAKLSSAVAANITHSHDSTHLAMTNKKLRLAGVKQVAYVHDSFGTNYDNAQLLLDSAKETWVELYSIDWLERYYNEWNQYLAENNKEVRIPHWSQYLKKGTLDVNEVKNSDWFFG